MRSSRSTLSPYSSFAPISSRELTHPTHLLPKSTNQDVNELEAAARQRPGVPRSDKKLLLINKKLTKLEAAFNEILTYF
jgi:hypothetical protein